MDRKIVIGLAILLAVSCNKQEVDNGAMDNIRFDVEITETKSLVNSATDLMTDGNELTIFDVHTRTDGSTIQYLNNQKIRYNGGKWNFVDGSGNRIDIPWTKQGHHHFLAYLSKYSGKVGTVTEYNHTGSADNQFMSIQNHTITTDNQFDFMYAEAVRDIKNQGDGAVTLKMKHLFAAVDFQIRNVTGYDMTVNSFKINDMRVSGTAQIRFGANPVITLDAAPSENGFKIENKIIPSSSNQVSLYNSFLMWPHRSDYYKDLQISITYKLGTGTSKTVNIDLTTANPGISSWDAGCRYVYTITISDIILIDVVKVVDWINDDVILQQ